MPRQAALPAASEAAVGAEAYVGVRSIASASVGRSSIGGPDRYWDVTCFELPPANTRGNLGRNSLTGPGLVNADLALVKSFHPGSTHSLQVRLEAFNVFNRANFAVPSGRVAFTGVDAQGNPIVAPTWGRITSTVTTARQIQLGVKFAF